MRNLPFISALIAPWCFAPRADAPAFRPAADTTLTKVFAQTGSLELRDFSLDVDGQDMGGMMGSMEFTLDTETGLTIQDTYVSSSHGRPEHLKRTFEVLKSLITVTGGAGGEVEENPMEASSPLEGRTVAFTWNAQEGQFDAAFEGSGGAADLLEGLEEEMDMRFLLPAGEVAAGATWEVNVEDLLPLVRPGGDLGFETPDEDEEAAQMLEDLLSEKVDELKDLLRGTCTCTYKGSSEAEGQRLGEIEVVVEIASAADLSSLIEEAIQKIAAQSGETEMPIDVTTADVNLDVQGGGTLLWDLGAGHIHSLDMKSECQVSLDVSVSIDAHGESHSANLSAEFSGKLEQSVETKE
jgi:hypothetical protein